MLNFTNETNPLLLFLFVDITKPNFANNSRCDNGITITNNTAKGKNYGLINFDAIGVTDNSGDAPVVQSTPPGYELGRTYQINYTIGDGLDINFKASDAAGNFRICRFKVKVSGKIIPSIYFHKLSQEDWTFPVFFETWRTHKGFPNANKHYVNPIN